MNLVHSSTSINRSAILMAVASHKPLAGVAPVASAPDHPGGPILLPGHPCRIYMSNRPNTINLVEGATPESFLHVSALEEIVRETELNITHLVEQLHFFLCESPSECCKAIFNL